MAYLDSADMLARAKRDAARPSSDQAVADADWYAWITERHDYWVRQVAVHAPWAMLSAPTTLTSADSGLTYTFASSILPLAVIVMESVNGRVLRPCTIWDPNGDYHWEGDKMRHPMGRLVTYANGPVAQYVVPGTTVDGSTAPTLLPSALRQAVVAGAVASFMRAGGYKDPTPFERREQAIAWGDPMTPGDVGILGGIKLQNPFRGLEAFAQPGLWGMAYVGNQSYSPA